MIFKRCQKGMEYHTVQYRSVGAFLRCCGNSPVVLARTVLKEASVGLLYPNMVSPSFIPSKRRQTKAVWSFRAAPFFVGKTAIYQSQTSPPRIKKRPGTPSRFLSIIRKNQPARVFATSAAKSSSFFSMPSPTAMRTKPTTSTPASLAA
jgi:hypothetical protein